MTCYVMHKEIQHIAWSLSVQGIFPQPPYELKSEKIKRWAASGGASTWKRLGLKPETLGRDKKFSTDGHQLHYLFMRVRRVFFSTRRQAHRRRNFNNKSRDDFLFAGLWREGERTRSTVFLLHSSVNRTLSIIYATLISTHISGPNSTRSKSKQVKS